MGLDNLDRRMLRGIIEYYGGRPVGLEALAATINEEPITLEDVYEPYLLQQGFLIRTRQGRCVTQKAYEHLGIEFRGQAHTALGDAEATADLYREMTRGRKLRKLADMRTVSERLGHADVATTMRIYGHVLPGRDEQAADLFAEVAERMSSTGEDG